MSDSWSWASSWTPIVTFRLWLTEVRTLSWKQATQLTLQKYNFKNIQSKGQFKKASISAVDNAHVLSNLSFSFVKLGESSSRKILIEGAFCVKSILQKVFKFAQKARNKIFEWEDLSFLHSRILFTWEVCVSLVTVTVACSTEVLLTGVSLEKVL
jgi:hypothetical protein